MGGDRIPPAELILANGIGVADRQNVATDFDKIGRGIARGFTRNNFITPKSDVLDVGCGLGRVARALIGFLDTGLIAESIRSDRRFHGAKKTI